MIRFDVKNRDTEIMKFTLTVFFTLLAFTTPQTTFSMSTYNKGNTGDEFLYFAIYAGDEESVKKFLENNIDPNGSNAKHLFSNVTPLELAIERENFNLVRMLVNKGALIDQENSNGLTAFSFSVVHYFKLLENFANTEAHCKDLYKARLKQTKDIVIYFCLYSRDKKNRDYADKVLSLTSEDVIKYQEQLIDEQHIQDFIIHSEAQSGYVAIPLVDLASKVQTILS
jgi:hypothetical protein